MKTEISNKIKKYFASMAIYKDPASTNSLFAGRNLPSFVKDFILKKYINADGQVDRGALTAFLDNVIPQDASSVKDRLGNGQELTLLTRFIIYIDLVKGIRRFSIPDLGIKLNEGQIPEYVYQQHSGDLVDGEKWGVIKLCVLPDENGKKNHVEMVEYKPFKPYRSVDMAYLREARKGFTTSEWLDVLLSAMEYDPDGFDSISQKLEFLTRLLIFVEPRLMLLSLHLKELVNRMFLVICLSTDGLSVEERLHEPNCSMINRNNRMVLSKITIIPHSMRYKLLSFRNRQRFKQP